MLVIVAERARAIHRKQESGTAGEVLKLEESVGFLDKHVRRALAKQGHKEFTAALRERRQTLHSSGRGHVTSAGGSSDVSGRAGRLAIPKASSIGHAEAKRYSPRGGFMWRSRSGGA